jgi:hypothetical protein
MPNLRLVQATRAILSGDGKKIAGWAPSPLFHFAIKMESLILALTHLGHLARPISVKSP